MTKGLHIARGLHLPLEYVTKSTAILAQRRKGKTYTASVIAEEMVAVEIPFVVLDPTGAWWGLRASADGKGPGLPVVIIGGQHGDVPLERGAGAFVAELVIDEPGYYVIDVKGMPSKAAVREFATDFAERLYHRKGQPGADFPMHLFVDEADMFVPQRIPKGDERMLGAFESIVRRGGLSGLGTTLVSQRAAVVNKNVLEQLDLLVILRTVGPNDRAAIDDYVKANGTEVERRTLMGSLASLGLGEAWLWEPGAEPPLFDRVKIRERHTFNSSATPKVGEKRIEPRTLADVDLDALKDRMAETIAKAENDDPVKLRRRIAELERELRTSKVEAAPAEPIEISVPYVPTSVLNLLGQLRPAIAGLGDQVDKVLEDLQEVVADGGQDVLRARPAGDGAGALGAGRRAEERPHPTPRRDAGRPPVPRPAPSAGDVDNLSRSERSILTVLVQHPPGRARTVLAFLSGYSAKSSSFGNALGALRSKGLVEKAGDPIRATADGIAALPDVEQLPAGAELLAHWRGRLTKAERAILDVIVDAWPNEVDRQDLADRSGYSSTSSSFGNALGRLRSLEMVTGFRLSDALAEAIE